MIPPDLDLEQGAANPEDPETRIREPGSRLKGYVETSDRVSPPSRKAMQGRYGLPTERRTGDPDDAVSEDEALGYDRLPPSHPSLRSHPGKRVGGIRQL